MATPVEPSSNPGTGRMSHHGAPDMDDSRLLAPYVSTDVDQGACGRTYAIVYRAESDGSVLIVAIAHQAKNEDLGLRANQVPSQGRQELCRQR
jgi:hypothetical protein